MIIPDVNLLIYAYDQTSELHGATRRWWEATLRGEERVGIPWIVALAFVRLTTHPMLNQNPMTVRQAREAVESWLLLDHVALLAPGAITFSCFFDLLEEAGTGGNLTTDAMIAALALEHGGRIHSNDRDFSRFRKIIWENPLDL
ncbi:TA system VapC family ribonuclease toxin [Methylacidimicrobium tartarophylax]|uniref:Ribonuclease VapC n=1 Tax=Methylacidimicrobium tartarophylax TaxID=1041768 RepID=A0A5E6M5W1_9BACT|nr:TA system VapC family ribonuclease toxin [Methylacidimicrobium tartarophylax]VVM04944.1 Ribonuclease VapC37 [Methylacidimicrobium tartarophylax]